MNGETGLREQGWRNRCLDRGYGVW